MKNWFYIAWMVLVLGLEDIATAHPGSVAALVLATPFRPADR